MGMYEALVGIIACFCMVGMFALFVYACLKQLK